MNNHRVDIKLKKGSLPAAGAGRAAWPVTGYAGRCADKQSITGGIMSEIRIFESATGKIQVILDEETVWLSLNQLSELFERDKSVISRHLRRIFAEKELSRDSVVAKNATTASDGKTYQVEYFNLDAIISVGYRVNSRRAVLFRQWATSTLKEHLTRGYTINQQRFEQNAQELEAALKLVRKAAASPQLQADTGRGLVEIISRYTQTFPWLSGREPFITSR